MDAKLHEDCVLDIERASNCETTNGVLFKQILEVQCVVAHLQG